MLIFLIEHPKYHWLVICPDMSPENAPQAHQGSSLDAGVTMTNQIVFDVFSTAIRAAQILNTDSAFADTLEKLRSRLAPMHIGQYGQLQEWLDDVDDPNDHHRHISHLYGSVSFCSDITLSNTSVIQCSETNAYSARRCFNGLEHGMESKLVGKNAGW